MRGIFYDEDTAHVVRRLLVQDGYTAEVVREPYAGEDDDEAHPWAVVTDAPAIALELLVDAYDGWFDDSQEERPAPAQPLDLPMAPKRHHQPPTD